MELFLSMYLPVILSTIGGIVIRYLPGILSNVLAQKKINTQHFMKSIAEDLVADAVKAVMQKQDITAKKDKGFFKEEDANSAKAEAVLLAVHALDKFGATGKAGFTLQWIGDTIEKVLHEMKNPERDDIREVND